MPPYQRRRNPKATFNNRFTAEALHPYLAGLVICTKVGATRRLGKSWVPFNTSENLHSSIDNTLDIFKQEQIQLVHLRLMGHGAVLLEEQLGTKCEMQRAGKSCTSACTSACAT